MNKYQMYLIETLTNTHVGSGESNLGTVDNLLQRDAVTSIPVFNASSVKGALRDHCEEHLLHENYLKVIFGSEGASVGENKKSRPADFQFFQAQLLTLPLRASRRIYYNCTSISVLCDYFDFYRDFLGLKNKNVFKYLEEIKNKIEKDFLIFKPTDSLEIEDYKDYNVHEIVEKDFQETIDKLGLSLENLAVFDDERFKEICESSIPVIARNAIGDDGTSKNLFYEEVLPRRSRLWFIIGYPEERETEFNKLGKLIVRDEEGKKQIVQFGANRSIGYGACQIKIVENKEAANEQP